MAVQLYLWDIVIEPSTKCPATFLHPIPHNIIDNILDIAIVVDIKKGFQPQQNKMNNESNKKRRVHISEMSIILAK